VIPVQKRNVLHEMPVIALDRTSIAQCAAQNPFHDRKVTDFCAAHFWFNGSNCKVSDLVSRSRREMKCILCTTFGRTGEKRGNEVQNMSFIFRNTAISGKIAQIKDMKCTSSGQTWPNLRNEVHEMHFVSCMKCISCTLQSRIGQKRRHCDLCDVQRSTKGNRARLTPCDEFSVTRERHRGSS
jgi:hypothetical protein